MKTILACAGSLALLAAAPALAGTWSCGPGCDLATLKGITWTPGTDKCSDPPEPPVQVTTAKKYNDSATATNQWISKKQEYLKCLSDELNADFTSAQTNMQESARANFDTIQKTFSNRVEEISKILDDGLKKLNGNAKK